MKRYYRVRFILAAMLSFLLLMVLTVGGIWMYSYRQMETETDRFLESRLNADSESQQRLSQESTPSMFGYTSRRRLYPSAFYDLTFSAEGGILSAARHGITEEAPDSLRQSASEAAARGIASGKFDTFKFRAKQNEDGTRRMILLDISIQLHSLYNTLRSALLVALAMSAMLLVILLPVSSRVASVFVQNAEKQKRFITDAGHDLKTPVAIVRANLDVLELTQGKNRWSANIRSQVDRLEKLVQQLVMMARLDESSERKSAARLPLSSLLREEWQEYLPAMRQKNISGQDGIEAELAVKGVEDAMRELLRLLLDNAVQYTPEGGEIRLKAAREKKRVRVTLINTVESLPCLEPEKLTERFVRGDEARTQKSGGAGIGLSAAKRITEMHSGRLEIRYGEDKTFCVTADFPLHA